ncbi:MAG: biotin/lipoyl-containing protein [Chloroflexota bacterium]
MPEAPSPGDRSPAQREADHASLARLSDTLVPALVQKLAASGLGELEVREGNWRIRLRRPAAGAHAVPAASATRRGERSRLGPGHPAERPHGPERAHPPEREARARGGSPGVGADGPDEGRAVATSPAVGVFRAGATPGSRVRAGDRIGTVDLLGIPQDVVSPVDGTLVEILATSGEAVEYGEPIAAVEADPAPAAPDDADGEA